MIYKTVITLVVTLVVLEMTRHFAEARPKVLDRSIEKEDKSLKKQLDRAEKTLSTLSNQNQFGCPNKMFQACKTNSDCACGRNLICQKAGIKMSICMVDHMLHTKLKVH